MEIAKAKELINKQVKVSTFSIENVSESIKDKVCIAVLKKIRYSVEYDGKENTSNIEYDVDVIDEADAGVHHIIVNDIYKIETADCEIANADIDKQIYELQKQIIKLEKQKR